MKSIIVNGKEYFIEEKIFSRFKAFENTNEINIPVEITQEDIELLDLYFNYGTSVIIIEDMKKLIAMLTYFDYDTINWFLYVLNDSSYYNKYKFSELFITEEQKQKYWEYMKFEELIDQPIEFLKSLKNNEILDKTYQALFGREGTYSLDVLMKFKEKFNKNKVNILNNCPNFIKYISDYELYDSCGIEDVTILGDKFEYGDYHPVDEKINFSCSGDISAKFKVNVHWSWFLDYCVHYKIDIETIFQQLNL